MNYYSIWPDISQVVLRSQQRSGDSGMYPYQRTPMGNPYIRPISRGYLWVPVIPKNPKVEHQLNTMGGYTYVNGVHPIPLSLEKDRAPELYPHGFHQHIFDQLSSDQLILVIGVPAVYIHEILATENLGNILYAILMILS